MEFYERYYGSQKLISQDEGFVSTVNEYLRSDNAATRRAVVETLVELLDGTSEESKAKQVRYHPYSILGGES